MKVVDGAVLHVLASPGYVPGDASNMKTASTYSISKLAARLSMSCTLIGS